MADSHSQVKVVPKIFLQCIIVIYTFVALQLLRWAVELKHITQ